MAINWELGVMPDIMGNALAAYKQSRVEKREEDGRAALSAYATNPDDPAAKAGMAKNNPQFYMEDTQRRAKAQRQKQEDLRADLPLMLKLLNHARKDPQSWQKSIATAQEYGIDTSNIPGQYDPQWAEQQIEQLQPLQDPKAQEALSTAGKIATDQLGQDKVGTPEWRQRVTEIWQSGESKPYVVGGETRLYTPKLGGPGQVRGGPQPSQVEEGYRFKGGNPADPSAWEQVGGGVSNGTGGFRP